jgi:hypothetical protein
LGSSSYSITIQPPQGKTYPDGSEVTFKINGYRASQTGVFRAGSSQRLDLTASSGAAQAGGLNFKFLIGIAVVLLIVAGVAYYLGRMRPAKKAVKALPVQDGAGGTVRPEKRQPQKVPSQPPRLVVHLKQPSAVRKPAPRHASVYSQGVLCALEAHGLSPDSTVSVQKTITCPGCRRQFTVMVPKTWIITPKPHLADGAPSYSKRTSRKELFEIDVACPKGHRIHLDWDWITPPAPRT